MSNTTASEPAGEHLQLAAILARGLLHHYRRGVPEQRKKSEKTSQSGLA
jgi:hypothetical protein